MKNLPFSRPFLFCLFGILFHFNLIASGSISSGPDLSKSRDTKNLLATPPPCYTPTWPLTSNITQNAATFSWDAASGAQNYSVQTRTPNGTWYNVPGSPTSYTSITVTWFLPNTTYEWRVRSNCSGGEYSSWTYPVTFTTLGWDPCNAPDWLATNNITQNSATLDWDPVAGAVSYDLQYRQTNGSWINVPGGPFTQTWYTLTGLQPGTSYEWRVQTNCNNWMESPWSYPAYFTTLNYYSCDHPTWLYTSNITQTSAKLNWDAVPGAQNYSIQLRTTNGSWYDVQGGPFYGTWYTLWDLQPGTCYEWRIRSNCSNYNYSSWSYPEAFCTLGYSCSVPTWPVTSNITQSSATFSWDEVWGAVSYSVQVRESNGQWWDVQGSPTYNNWISVSGLLDCTTYQWRVKANCGGGSYSYWTNPVSFTTICEYSCVYPSWLYTSNISQTSATLNWDPVPGATSYTIQLRESNGNWFNIPGNPFYGTWTTLWDLDPGSCYTWRIKSNCSNWESSDYTWPEPFCTLGYSCSTPTWPTTSNITSTSATFSWDEVWGANSYTVQIRQPNGSWWDLPNSPTYSTWISATGLNPCTTYHWRVKANCGYGSYSYWTQDVVFTTQCNNYCAAPGWLYTSNITETTAKLNWDAIPGAYSYSLQLRTTNGNWYDVPGGPFTGTWYTLWDLQPGTCYEWRVRANCSNWSYSAWSYAEYFCTLGYSCGTPTWPSTYGITQTSATFSWDLVPGAYSYSVQLQQSNGEWWDVAGSPTYSTWITVYGLNACTTYKWRVKANCGNGNYSYWTQPIVFTTLCQYSCHAPYWLYATEITQTSAKLGWDAVNGAISYSVQYRPVGSNTWAYVPGGPFTNTWITLNGLQPATKYEWRVKTNCSDWSSSEWSYAAWFTTLGNNNCVWPSGLTTYDITESSARLTWYAVYGAASYSVEMRQPNGLWVPVTGSPFTQTFVTVVGLTPGTTYEWRVRTNCYNGGYSVWANSVFTTLSASACSPPATLSTSQITDSSAYFDWSDVNGALSYDLQIRVLPGGDWEYILGGPWTVSNHTMTGLLPGTSYEWRVRSKCNAGLFSEWSYETSFTTLVLPCTVPAGTATNNITDTSVTVSWVAVPGATSYDLQIMVPNGAWTDVPGSPFTNNSVTIDGLIPGTNYSWRVRANCNGGEHSGWSSPLNFTTTGTSPSGSDECDGATQLAVNTSCVPLPTSNIGATESSPEPMGWCPENEYNDVWFKFTMPDVPDPVVTIRTIAGTLTDGIMEVYRGGGCADLEYIFCEDDNYTGNGSTMPVISVTGNPNETIWVRVWGYAGTTGTFSICVFDYQSNDFAAPDNTPDVFFDGEALDPVKEAEVFETEISTTLHVSPNPTSDLLQISYAQTKESRVTRVVMLDMSGKIVFKKEYPANDLHEFRDQLDVSDFAQGIYILQAVTSSGIISERVSVVD